MGLLNRLIGADGSIKISVHQFWAALKELHYGELTVSQVKTEFNMDTQDQIDFDWLISQYTAQPNVTEKAEFVELMHSIFMLAEANTPLYNTEALVQARIERI